MKGVCNFDYKDRYRRQEKTDPDDLNRGAGTQRSSS